MQLNLTRLARRLFSGTGRPQSETAAPDSAGTIDAIYGMIVAQAREAAFYRDLGVPDTVNGRFDLLVLHLALVLRRIRAAGGMAAQATAERPAGTGEGPGQLLFDRFCRDMDDNLREMGVSDLAVPRKMRAFGEAFYGRAVAYDAALDKGSLPDLADAIGRNILGQATPSADAGKLANYALRLGAALEAAPLDDVLGGRFQFPAPTEGSAQ